MSGRPAILLLTPSALYTARRLQDALEGSELLAPAGESPSFAEQVRALFRAGRPIVGLCAAGVLVRILAPLLADKRAEPPVIAVAEDGSAVVPMLGGHRGANDLARRIADALGVAAAITTASELRFGVALDDPPSGWRLADPAAVKPFTAALLAGARLRLDGHAPWLSEGGLPIQEAADLTIHISRGEVAAAGPGRLVYHPAVLAVGIGCERGAEPDEVVGLLRRTLAEAGLAEAAVAAVFSIDLKADEPAVHDAAAALGVEARFFDAATLEAETPRLVNPSETVFREVGAHGVAEAAALAAAGPEAELIVPKTKSRRATVAIARAPQVIEPAAAGRPRGSLAVVGIGPGRADWRTPEADAALAAADDLVGYGLYLDLAGGPAPGQARHNYGLGEEQQRVRAALDLAAAGRKVALVCSGDAGIYAMAALVFEELETAGRADWRRVAIQVVPGVSAMQAAAARAGAPLGHDFCAVSLSDLLTPWAVIERRLRAAAEGDFVLALYNPVSGRRKHQLARARDILLGHRPAETPVVLARNLGRDGEAIRVVSLGELRPEMADMLTLVLVGASTTRIDRRGDGGVSVYTPRGYAAKTEDASEPGDAA